MELDGDLSHDPEEVSVGINKLLDNQADVSIGSKYLQKSKIIRVKSETV